MTTMLPARCVYRKFDSKRYFGIELEMSKTVPARDIVKIIKTADSKHNVQHHSAYMQDANNDYWHLKWDHSCGIEEGQYGWEIASYVAHGFRDIVLFGKIAEALSVGGCKVNNRCGLHIHVDAKDIPEVNMTKIVLQWIRFEHLILQMLPIYRRDNAYCLSVRRALEIWRGKFDLQKLFTPEEQNYKWNMLVPLDNGNLYRRVALNLCNYQFMPHKRTIEIRTPECILSKQHVINWIRFFLMFIEGALIVPAPNGDDLYKNSLNDFLIMMRLSGDSCFYLLSKALYELKLWLADRLLSYSSDKSLLTQAQELRSKLTV